MASRAPRLQTLNLTDCTVSEHGMRALSDLTRLRDIAMPGRHVVTDAMVGAMARWPLERLDLTNCNTITGTPHAETTSARCVPPSALTAVVLHCADAVGPHLEALAPTLRTLSLANTKVTDAVVAHIGTLSHLNSLTLSRTAVSNDGIKALAHAGLLLQTLDLHFTAVGDAAVAAINAMAGLVVLDLSHTALTDWGLSRVRLPKLTHLRINGCAVSPALVRLLPDMLPSLARLHSQALAAAVAAESPRP